MLVYASRPIATLQHPASNFQEDEQKEREVETKYVDPVILDDFNPKQAEVSAKAKIIWVNATLLSTPTKLKECDKIENAFHY
jgi:hypothetical protein